MKRWAEAGAAVVVLASLLWTLAAPYSHGDAGAVADKALTSSDFGAFYCAAAIARAHGDPYDFVPLRRCEIDTVYEPGGETYARMGIDPAPLPLYDLALFAPLTLLPYRTAGLVWIGILVCATVAAAVLLARLTKIPFALTLAALAVTDGTLCFAFGQTQPLVTLALVGAALLLRDGKTNLAIVVASFSFIEPHVGLASMLALFVWTKSRYVAAACCTALGLIAVEFGGVATNLEYFLHVLPAHAFAEIPVWFQYSLTSLLHAAGVDDRPALWIASLQYVVTVAVAISCAGPLARRIGSPAIVLFPAAAAVFGGPFIHLTQLASAIPFALYLAGTVPAWSTAGWAAALLLGLQWPATSRLIEVIAVVLIIGAASLVARASMRASLTLAAATAAMYFVANHDLKLAPFQTAVLPLTHVMALAAVAPYDTSLASTQYSIDTREDSDLSEFSVRRFAERFPAWLALLIVFGSGLALSRRTPVGSVRCA